MEFFKGPLGSHRNYLTYIALDNCTDYFNLRKGYGERNDTSTSAKYKEFRYFLNAVESLNSVLEYFFYENEGEIRHARLERFKEAVHNKHSELRDISHLANAYKHCVRQRPRGGEKQANLPWAKDLQHTRVFVNVNVSHAPGIAVTARYDFEGPTHEHEEILNRAFEVWLSYLNDPASTMFKEA